MKWNEAKSGRLIRKAADIIRDRGLAKGYLKDSNDAYCIRGAINFAWSGNPYITYNFEYCKEGQLKNGLIAFPTLNRRGMNPEVIQAITDFRQYLYENDLLGDHGYGVEHFNDNNDKEEVLRWMNKYADEVDPRKT